MRFWLHYQGDTPEATWTEELDFAELCMWLQSNARYPQTKYYDANSFALQQFSTRHTIKRLA